MDKSALAGAIHTFFSARYTTVENLTEGDVIFTFGRADPEVAMTASAVYKAGMAQVIVVTGGIGKDSGLLPQLGLSEAGYLIALMLQEGVSPTHIFGEFAAKNGGENCRNGIALLRAQELIVDEQEREPSMILVGHWASLYRLYEMMQTEGRKLHFAASYQLVPTPRPEVLDEKDIAELIAEFGRLVNWPEKGMLDDVDLPKDLVQAFKEFEAAS